jgi:hypothetical protein
MAPQYRGVSAFQKRTLLEAFIGTTGYVPKFARWLLNYASEVQQTHGHSHLRRYGPDVQHALFLAWNAANRICAKRLIPFLPILIEALERHEYLHITKECRRLLLSMSAATADRRYTVACTNFSTPEQRVKIKYSVFCLPRLCEIVSLMNSTYVHKLAFLDTIRKNSTMKSSYYVSLRVVSVVDRYGLKGTRASIHCQRDGKSAGGNLPDSREEPGSQVFQIQKAR